MFKLHGWQSFCTASFHVLFGLPLGVEPSTSYSIHFFTQSVSSFGAHAHTTATCFAVVSILLGHRLGDDLIHLLFEVVSVRPSVRTSTKSFSDFHVIWCVGRPWPHMHTCVTSTRSKVKVTELPKLRKVHFYRSISSAVFAWSSKVMVGGDSMGPGLQLVGAQFLNFLSGKLSREFKLRHMSIFHDIPMAVFR